MHKPSLKLTKHLILLFLLLFVANSLAADESLNFLFSQLETMAKHQHNQQENTQNVQIINNFVKTQKNENRTGEFSPESIAAIEAFFQLAFSENEASGNIVRALDLSGRLFSRRSMKNGKRHGPFSEHVIEAIEVNQIRSDYYAKVSQNRSKGLSRLYTSLESAILPMAKIFDRWASFLWKKGIPVLKNDFVHMTEIPEQEACPPRMGCLNKAGTDFYKQVMRSFRQKSRAAAWRKDFVALQVHSISALHQLKTLQEKHHCNLSLSIHLIESIGLAARNADQLKQSHKNHSAADSFYRAFILSQIVGTRMFERIDLKAQFFHQAGIGIITNDLPAIPFP